MKKTALILLFAGFAAFVAVASLAPDAEAQVPTRAVTVTRVIDGDTVEIRPAIGGKNDVRLIGVDTPETVDPNTPDEPYGEQASRFTERQLEGERVELEFGEEREDQYGRLLAYVRFPDEKLFNATLLRRGYARVLIISPNDRYERSFEQMEEQARQAGRGLWDRPGLGEGFARRSQASLRQREEGGGNGLPGSGGPAIVLPAAALVLGLGLLGGALLRGAPA